LVEMSMCCPNPFIEQPFHCTVRSRGIAVSVVIRCAI
jgi:hypothetical protein